MISLLAMYLFMDLNAPDTPWERCTSYVFKLVGVIQITTTMPLFDRVVPASIHLRFTGCSGCHDWELLSTGWMPMCGMIIPHRSGDGQTPHCQESPSCKSSAPMGEEILPSHLPLARTTPTVQPSCCDTSQREAMDGSTRRAAIINATAAQPTTKLLPPTLSTPSNILVHRIPGAARGRRSFYLAPNMGPPRRSKRIETSPCPKPGTYCIPFDQGNSNSLSQAAHSPNLALTITRTLQSLPDRLSWGKPNSAPLVNCIAISIPGIGFCRCLDPVSTSLFVFPDLMVGHSLPGISDIR
ncbi:hypothetical protein GGR50DRAFT_247343 [Xylaria sp. CBS 124048]|nr:hypothetical protein GGR50DRAFT_247343 [Xylaria sp. CBS 124048]